MLCDAGLPVPDGKRLVDVSLVAGLPTVTQVLKAVCSEMLIEAICVPEVYISFHREFFQEMQEKFVNQKMDVLPNEAWPDFVYGDDVKLYIRTGDVTPCSNMVLVSASGVPRHYKELNVEFENILA